jgi:acetate kinase
MSDRLLTVNAGSSSLKFATFRLDGDGDPRCEIRGQLSGIGQGVAKLGVTGADWRTDDLHLTTHRDALDLLIARLGGDWRGVGHRVVHGGTRFIAPVGIDAGTVAALKGLIPLAPLHQPHNVAAIEAVAAALPGVPQIACFDTAFHATQPEVAARFALPERYWRAGIRRYGFHGLSYEAILHRMTDVPPRLVIAHLGNGASMAAVRQGRCIATTMGFSALDGLMMGTRGGLLDPGVILHLIREGMSAAALERLLYHECGLLGVSEIGADMKTLLASDDPRARLAIEMYCSRIARELGSLAAALEGIDALVFTGGVGENAAPIRDQVCAMIRWLGPIAVHVVPTDEELTIARHARRLLAR